MQSQTILVVDDDVSIREIVEMYLSQAGFAVVTAANGSAAMRSVESRSPDLVVLDLMLPDRDGLDLARDLRLQGDVPIIILSARREEAERILGLEMGADDYVVKPFSPRELVSRVKAVLRRAGPPSMDDDEAGVFEFEGLHIDTLRREVVAHGQSVSLTATEFELLSVLAQHPGQVFNREQLLDQIWGITEYVDPSTVTVHVRRLREKIEPDPSDPRYIQTVWGVGYKLDP